ncbi:DUF1573 domain-containing protein [Roseimicrobium sp. ORNL1]|nr:DUF1573 domain-containing protein [Roseimicrobium sp. ORNL1]
MPQKDPVVVPATKEGERIVIPITFHNSSNRQLRIEKISSSCSCAAIKEYAGTPVAAYGDIAVEVVVKVPAVVGLRETTIAVEYSINGETKFTQAKVRTWSEPRLGFMLYPKFGGHTQSEDGAISIRTGRRFSVVMPPEKLKTLTLLQTPTLLLETEGPAEVVPDAAGKYSRQRFLIHRTTTDVVPASISYFQAIIDPNQNSIRVERHSLAESHQATDVNINVLADVEKGEDGALTLVAHLPDWYTKYTPTKTDESHVTWMPKENGVLLKLPAINSESRVVRAQLSLTSVSENPRTINLSLIRILPP